MFWVRLLKKQIPLLANLLCFRLRGARIAPFQPLDFPCRNLVAFLSVIIIASKKKHLLNTQLCVLLPYSSKMSKIIGSLLQRLSGAIFSFYKEGTKPYNWSLRDEHDLGLTQLAQYISHWQH